MASICENDYWKITERRYRTLPPDNSNNSPIHHGIAFVEMSDDQNDQISNGYQCNDTSIFERVQTP